MSKCLLFTIVCDTFVSTVKGNETLNKKKKEMGKITLEQAGMMQEVSKAKAAFANSGVRYCERKAVINRIQETGGSFQDCLLDEARVLASSLKDEQDVRYWNSWNKFPCQFEATENDYFFVYVAEVLYNGVWDKLMEEVWGI